MSIEAKIEAERAAVVREVDWLVSSSTESPIEQLFLMAMARGWYPDGCREASRVEQTLARAGITLRGQMSRVFLRGAQILVPQATLCLGKRRPRIDFALVRGRVIRFTGSEVYADSGACVEQAIEIGRTVAFPGLSARHCVEMEAGE